MSIYMLKPGLNKIVCNNTKRNSVNEVSISSFRNRKMIVVHFMPTFRSWSTSLNGLLARILCCSFRFMVSLSCSQRISKQTTNHLFFFSFSMYFNFQWWVFNHEICIVSMNILRYTTTSHFWTMRSIPTFDFYFWFENWKKKKTKENSQRISCIWYWFWSVHKINGELKFHNVTAWKSEIRTTQIGCARMRSCVMWSYSDAFFSFFFFFYLDSYTKTIYLVLNA